MGAHFPEIFLLQLKQGVLGDYVRVVLKIRDTVAIHPPIREPMPDPERPRTVSDYLTEEQKKILEYAKKRRIDLFRKPPVQFYEVSGGSRRMQRAIAFACSKQTDLKPVAAKKNIIFDPSYNRII